MSDSAANIAWRQAALDAFERHDYRAAADLLARRVAVAPQDIEARCKLGAAYSCLGLHTPALEQLRYVIHQRPGQAELFFYYGSALARARQNAEAQTALREALRLDPTHARAKTQLKELQQLAALERSSSPRSVVRHLATLPLWWLGGHFACAIVALFLLILFGPYLLVVNGWNGIQQALESPALRTVTFDQFAASPPQKGWFRVNGGLMDVAASGYVGWSHKTTIYVPVFSPSSQGGTKASLIFQTEDPQLVDLLARRVARENGAPGAGPAPTDQDCILQRDVEGVLKSPQQLDSYGAQVVSRLQPVMAPNCAVLVDGEKPNLALSIASLIGGLFWGMVWCVLVYWWLQRRRRAFASGTAAR